MQTACGESNCPATIQSSVASLVDRLLDRIPGDADWSQIIGAYEITFGLYVLLTSENQDFIIPAKQLARITSIGAKLWCDIYCDIYGDEEPAVAQPEPAKRPDPG